MGSVLFYFLWYQTHQFEGLSVLHSGGDEIDSRGFDAAVSKNICETGYIPADFIEGSGEQVTEIVGKHLPRLHAGLFTDGLHLRPNLLARQRTTASSEKQLTGGDFVFFWRI